MPLQGKQGLIPELWLKELENLRDTCSQADTASADRAVRRAFHLRTLSPKPLQRILPLDITERQIEALLEDDRVESAARAFVGRDWKIAISPSPIRGRVVARLSGRGNQVLEAAANCPALAIIGAWIQLLTGVPISATEPIEQKRRSNAGQTAGGLLRTA